MSLNNNNNDNATWPNDSELLIRYFRIITYGQIKKKSQFVLF